MGVIRYQFVASGADSVISAYKGIGKAAEDSAARAERAARRVQAAQAKAGPGGAGGAGARGAAKGMSSPASDPRVVQERAVQRELERERNRAAKAQAKADEKAARDKARQHEREAKAQARAEEATARARARQAAKAQSEAEKKRQQRRDLGKDIGMAAVGAVGAAGMAGVAMIGGMTTKGMEVDEMARRVAINSRLAGGKMLDARTIRQNMYEAAGEMPGQTAAGLAQATLAFQGATGQVLDVSTLKSLATVASGAGASIEDVASAAAALSNNMDIKGAEDMANALSVLAVQGAQGMFELKDMAALMGRVTAAAAGADISKDVKGVAQVGSLLQIARAGGSGAETSVTSIESVFRSMVSKSKEFRKAGIDVFQAGSGGRKMRDVNEVLIDTFKKTKGNKEQLKSMFDETASPVMNLLLKTFNEEYDKKQDLNAATDALRKQLEGAADVTKARSTVEEGAAEAQQSVTARMTAAWETATGKVANKVLPALYDMFNRMEKSGAIDAIIDSFEFAADVISENMGALADLAEKLGFEKKTPSLDKQLAKAEEKKAKLERKFEALDPATRMSSEEGIRIATEHMAAKEEVERIKGKMSTPVLAGAATAVGQGGGRQFLSQKDFVSKYVEAMGGGKMGSVQRALLEGRASQLFERVATTGTTQKSFAETFSPGSAIGSALGAAMTGGAENEQAQALVDRILSERSLMASGAQQKALGMEPTQNLDVAALEKLIAAANAAAGALQTVGAAGKANVTGITVGG